MGIDAGADAGDSDYRPNPIWLLVRRSWRISREVGLLKTLYSVTAALWAVVLLAWWSWAALGLGLLCVALWVPAAYFAVPPFREKVDELLATIRFALFIADWKQNALAFGLAMKDTRGKFRVPKLLSWRRADGRWFLRVQFHPSMRSSIPDKVHVMPGGIRGCWAADVWDVADERRGAGVTEIQLSFRRFPTHLEFEEDEARELIGTNRILVGRTAVMDTAAIDLDEEPTWLICGKRGSGKSALMLSIVLQLVWKIEARPPEDRPDVYILDMKRDAKYNFTTGYGVTLIHTIAEAAQLLEWVRGEMQRRIVAANESGHDRYQGNDLVLVFDELARLTTDPTIPDQTRQGILVALTEIAEIGRALGVKAIVATQSGSPKVLGGPQVMTNFKGSVIGLSDVGDFQSYLFDGDPDVVYLEGRPGRGCIRNASVPVTAPDAPPVDVQGVQVGFVDYERVLEMLPPPSVATETEPPDPTPLNPHQRETLQDLLSRRSAS